MNELFFGKIVHIHLFKAPLSSKLHIRGWIVEYNEQGVVIKHEGGLVTFFPWGNIMRIDLDSKA